MPADMVAEELRYLDLQAAAGDPLTGHSNGLSIQTVCGGQTYSYHHKETKTGD